MVWSDSNVARCTRPRTSSRPFLQRAAIREYAEAVAIDERPLRAAVKPLMVEQDKQMRAMRQKGMPHNEALLQCSQAFSSQIGEMCMATVLARDRRTMKLAFERGSDGLHALRMLGALDPPWLTWKRGREARVFDELGHNLDMSRPNREYELRARIVRTETAEGYTKTRMRPSDLASPLVQHVITAQHVERLRNGETLVLDPHPALLPPHGFAQAMADLLDVVRRKRGVTESNNPCNSGSWHGMLPCNPSAGGAEGLSAPTCQLLRSLSALPALVERYGWHRPLMLPTMLQLGYYPGGTGARYRPHLDRWANEVSNRRELTFLVYVNVGWDASKDGGMLRLHPDPNNPGTDTVDVEPIAGRIVIFESGKQMHEVCESIHGADRLALTLWVEYEEGWREPEKGMMPALQH